MIRPLLLVALLACSNKKKEEAPPPDKAAQEAAKPKQPLTAALFGKTVAPPGPLAKLKAGMPAKQAEEQLNAANERNELDGVHWWMGLAKDGKLDVTLMEFPTAKKGLVAEAWGPGQDTVRARDPATVWFNPELGIRAELSDERDHSTLRFFPYTPLAKLLGDGPAIAALSKPIVGLSQAEATKNYPELADHDGHLWLPATEWEFGGGTPVSPYPMEGTIESVAFEIPYKKDDPKSKAAVIAVLEKKWGKAKKTDELDPKTKIYNLENPHIEVSEGYDWPNALLVRMSNATAKKKGKK